MHIVCVDHALWCIHHQQQKKESTFLLFSFFNCLFFGCCWATAAVKKQLFNQYTAHVDDIDVISTSGQRSLKAKRACARSDCLYWISSYINGELPIRFLFFIASFPPYRISVSSVSANVDFARSLARSSMARCSVRCHGRERTDRTRIRADTVQRVWACVDVNRSSYIAWISRGGDETRVVNRDSYIAWISRRADETRVVKLSRHEGARPRPTAR